MNIDYKNHRNLVRQGFTERFKFPIGDGRTMPSLNIQHQKHDILLEEIKEYLEAIFAKDLKEILDALCDIEFVIHGAMDSYGFDLDEKRIDLNYSSTYANLPIDDMYSIFYRAFCFKEDIDKIEQLFYDMLSWHNYAVRTFYQKPTKEVLTKYHSAFREVCRSNETKSCSSKDVMYATIAQPKYKGIYFIHVEKNGEFALYRKDNGKLIKSIDYSPADVSPFIP